MVDIHSEEYILGQNIRKYRLRLGWSQADLRWILTELTSPSMRMERKV